MSRRERREVSRVTGGEDLAMSFSNNKGRLHARTLSLSLCLCVCMCVFPMVCHLSLAMRCDARWHLSLAMPSLACEHARALSLLSVILLIPLPPLAPPRVLP